MIALEVFFYGYKKPVNLDMFFFVWIFIYTALLLFSKFKVDNHNAGTGVAANTQTNYMISSMHVVESVFGYKSDKCSNSSKHHHKIRIVSLNYIVLIVANIILYLVFM